MASEEMQDAADIMIAALPVLEPPRPQDNPIRVVDRPRATNRTADNADSLEEQEFEPDTGSVLWRKVTMTIHDIPWQHMNNYEHMQNVIACSNL